MASRLTETQNKALQELKVLVENAIKNHQFSSYEGEEATLWGVPLLDDKRSRQIMLRFLKARDFRVVDAFDMIKNTLQWRAQVGVDTLLEEDLGNSYDRVLFTHGFDKDGFPVWYFGLGELSKTTSCDEEHLHKFYCWLIQFVEKNVQKLDDDFTGGRNSFALVIDLETYSWHVSRDFYKVVYRFLQLLQDYYPEFLEKQLWINVSWWYRYYSRAYCLVFDGWSTKKLVVFTGTSKTIDTLFKYISPGQVPVRYGGLSRENKEESSRFNTDDEPISEAYINPDKKHTLEFNFAEICDIHWDLRVLGWEISYEAEFVPSIKGRYVTMISRNRKLNPTDAPVISDSFRVTEPGKLVLTVHNTSSKTKKLVARVRVVAPGGTKGDEASLRGWLA
ncbi:hypothetical protein RND81_01G211100 [Saponaria officinalis]|uniref:CRAL-TRIO domain-containing protein n=1 Tax=Saponaria officinalis TaxID=3572 RepID=A0AAW1NHT8_SAPOF